MAEQNHILNTVYVALLHMLPTVVFTWSRTNKLKGGKSPPIVAELDLSADSHPLLVHQDSSPNKCVSLRVTAAQPRCGCKHTGCDSLSTTSRFPSHLCSSASLDEALPSYVGAWRGLRRPRARLANKSSGPERQREPLSAQSRR